MKRPFTLYAIVCLCLALTGCPEADDGSEGRDACRAYVSAANACLNQAGMTDDLLDAVACEDITTGYAVTETGISSCGFKDLVAVFRMAIGSR